MDAASASTEFSNRDPALRLIGLRESRVWGWVSPDGFGAPKSPPPPPLRGALSAAGAGVLLGGEFGLESRARFGKLPAARQQ